MPYPKPLGPQFSANIKMKYTNAISQEQPKVVLVGDSVLFVGVNHEELPKQLGVKTYSIALPGAGSAVWYLILKNAILESTHTPKYVVLLFRDTKLTMSSLHTTGPYFNELDDFAGRQEPLVTQLAYVNAMNPVEKLVEQYIPIYSARWEIRGELDAHIRYTAPSIFWGCPAACTDKILNAAFGKNDLNVTALNRGVEDLYAPEFMDFEDQIKKSFLPHIIQLAQENNITLIFIRTKSMTFPEYASEPSALRNYIKALDLYLSEQDHVQFLDLAHDERLQPDHFADTVHLNEVGKEIFTKILADELMKIVK